MVMSAFMMIGCSTPSPTPSSSSSPAVVEKVAITYYANETTVYSSTAELVSAVADTVVEISTESVTTIWGRQYIVSGAGSGVIVSKTETNDYYIITNNHVIEGANDITVKTRVGTVYNATLVATDDSEDIAVIKVVTTDELQLATFGNSDTLQVGEDLIAIGNPLGSLGGTVTKGILSAKGRSIVVGNYSMTLLQTDTAINPGNSGGGLFNMRGQLIGIVNAKKSDEEVEGICFAIPVNKAKTVYESLMEYGYVKGRATFDIVVAEGTLSTSSGSEEIAYVSNVNSAEENTFKQYDRIRTINGEEITSILTYNLALSHISAGDRVVVEVNRGSYRSGPWGGITFEDTITSFSITALQYGA